MSSMKDIRIEKVTLNIGAGKNQERLDKAFSLLKTITEKEPVRTTTQKRINAWGLRPGLPIGCKVTLRKKDATDVLKRLVEAKEFLLNESNYDLNGNIAFGLNEYIDIPGMKYLPDIGAMGLQVCVTLARPGFRVKYRKIQKRKIPKQHKISKEEAIKYMSDEFKIKIRGKEQ